MIQRRRASTVLLAGFLGLMTVSAPAAADIGWPDPDPSDPTKKKEYPVNDEIGPNCSHSCCYPHWLWEHGYIWHSATPPQPGDNNHQGDWDYDGWCTNPFINAMWDDWDFDDHNWDEGFGAYINPCDRRFPWARMLVALWLFQNSTSASTPNDELGLVLKNAYAWARDQTDEVDAKCSPDGTLDITARFISTAGDERVEFYWPFFYNTSVGERAMSLLHEARHADGCSHNALYTGPSTDFGWDNGCEWSFWEANDGMSELHGQAGANQYATTWGWAFYRYGQNTTPAVRARVLDAVNWEIANRFTEKPCFRVGIDGQAYQPPRSLCDWYSSFVQPDMQQNTDAYLSSQESYAYLSLTAPSGELSYDPSPWLGGKTFAWRAREVNGSGSPGLPSFETYALYQIYASVGVPGQDYCLRPVEPPQYQSVWLPWTIVTEPGGSPVPTGVECEEPASWVMEAVPCSAPTPSNPQRETWLHLTPTSLDATTRVLLWDHVNIRPYLRCRDAATHAIQYHTYASHLCVTTSGAAVLLFPCLDLAGQRINIRGWYPW